MPVSFLFPARSCADHIRCAAIQRPTACALIWCTSSRLLSLSLSLYQEEHREKEQRRFPQHLKLRILILQDTLAVPAGSLRNHKTAENSPFL
jgi:hypothetical protein